ncbi:uncharacterized protein LOC9662686 isoform X1 [Selaginella moellendorffii]|uniref:uncharacterized protein LOC9662686 isoform X1 n=1 Tax=Selaginella moellendorffii TaxID=88036 RepID=UPI000D1CEDCF|nr:uncharacterized protein LOC9662686 isoform X1 [Selaginella moellendorffii]XP_024517864.1 uncharacterized protein LOC9662686 isoform X1 [Selaginella moellendorffii]XP_024517865.1 uncharacterized protein LOC9662686 isoform X1 [Selaginella moellendorffii]XP_024517866.1 uncharacterized protein LOC9662686 isoform X1 [Selaginella moellendorffii]|eukprot:XP_024517863.1 uncharacterized protein LOC9662686 isoform X1 [Selaginella moellendorffii]
MAGLAAPALLLPAQPAYNRYAIGSSELARLKTGSRSSLKLKGRIAATPNLSSRLTAVAPNVSSRLITPASRLERLRGGSKCRLSRGVSLKDEVTSSNSPQEFDSQENPAGEEVAAASQEPDHIDLEFLEDADISGKTGFVSFYSGAAGEDRLLTGVKRRSLLWLLGPFVLVASVVLPPYVFRTVFEYLLDDTVVTDFIILFFTEAYFYIGVSAFLFVAHKFRGPVRVRGSKGDALAAASYTWGYNVSATVCTALSTVLAVSSFFVAWKYTGPAAIAALVPYVSGLVVQFCGEKFAEDKPSIRPLVPMIFQVYRLHQLNRAAQLVAGLIFSMKTLEASVQTTAITSSLQMLLSSLQLLGIFSLWSLAAFLTQTSLAWHHGKGVSLVPF